MRRNQMKTYLEKIYEDHPNWPRHIRHGEYTGVLSGVQPLCGGDAAPLYRFLSGECVCVDYEVCAVRYPAKEDDFGIIHCGDCGTLLRCDECGDMPNVCPVCHEGVDWNKWKL